MTEIRYEQTSKQCYVNSIIKEVSIENKEKHKLLDIWDIKIPEEKLILLESKLHLGNYYNGDIKPYFKNQLIPNNICDYSLDKKETNSLPDDELSLFNKVIKFSSAYTCNLCEHVFLSKHSLNKHKKQHNACVYCKVKLKSFKYLNNHLKNCAFKQCIENQPYVSLSDIYYCEEIRLLNKTTFEYNYPHLKSITNCKIEQLSLNESVENFKPEHGNETFKDNSSSLFENVRIKSEFIDSDEYEYCVSKKIKIEPIDIVEDIVDSVLYTDYLTNVKGEIDEEYQNKIVKKEYSPDHSYGIQNCLKFSKSNSNIFECDSKQLTNIIDDKINSSCEEDDDFFKENKVNVLSLSEKFHGKTLCTNQCEEEELDSGSRFSRFISEKNENENSMKENIVEPIFEVSILKPDFIEKKNISKNKSNSKICTVSVIDDGKRMKFWEKRINQKNSTYINNCEKYSSSQKKKIHSFHK